MLLLNISIKFPMKPFKAHVYNLSQHSFWIMLIIKCLTSQLSCNPVWDLNFFRVLFGGSNMSHVINKIVLMRSTIIWLKKKKQWIFQLSQISFKIVIKFSRKSFVYPIIMDLVALINKSYQIKYVQKFLRDTLCVEHSNYRNVS